MFSETVSKIDKTKELKFSIENLIKKNDYEYKNDLIKKYEETFYTQKLNISKCINNKFNLETSLNDLQKILRKQIKTNQRKNTKRKPRQAYTLKQLSKLESEFQVDKYLSVDKRIELSKSLNLSEIQIKTWFQNRRTKLKKQLTVNFKEKINFINYSFL